MDTDTAVAPQQGTVQMSNNYSAFSFLGANREVNQGHVEALKKAFEELGNLTQVQPILVNTELQIIDGQHRFETCRELGLPIYFTVAPGLGVREARQMNILHKGWNTDDYARSYANSGDPNYQKYVQLKETYGFSHSLMIAYIIGSADRKGIFKEFRDGDLVIDDEAASRERLDRLAEITEVAPIAKTRNFGIALLKSMSAEGYSQERMVRKLKAQVETLKPYNNYIDNMRQVEEVYNYKMGEGNRVRLF